MGTNDYEDQILQWRAKKVNDLRNGKVIRLHVADGVQVKVNGKLMQKAILKSNKETKPSYIIWNDMRMVLHEYADRVP
ncbi:MAG TPA: hypothetical protein VK888_02715 [Anaerolineales bacterium]|nr:hypothetical protein [Anaerolineales bacterium]